MATLKKNKITSCLWFDTQAEEAARYYTSIFKNSRIGKINHYGKEGKEVHGKPEGSVLTVEFWLEGQGYLALNGGPQFKFNESISIVIRCDTQKEIDYYWDKLSAGGDKQAQACGWLKDKYGLSWQVAPANMAALTSDEDRERADRVMKVMMPMKKLDLALLEAAYNQEPIGFKSLRTGKIKSDKTRTKSAKSSRSRKGSNVQQHHAR